MKDNVQKIYSDEADRNGREHAAPGTQIYYEIGLIEQLEKDHVRLLNLLQKVYVIFKQEKPKKTVKKLKKFKTVFMQHMILENLKLYIYLKHSFVEYSEEKDLVKGFRREMRKISKYAIAFVDKYKAAIKSKKQAEEFQKDLKSVYLTLKNRLKREERELFPLYQDKF